MEKSQRLKRLKEIKKGMEKVIQLCINLNIVVENIQMSKKGVNWIINK